MQINITWDASVANAPAGYKAAVQAAVTYLEQTLAAPITVNIAFGWGEVDGQALPAGSIGSSLSSGYALTYQEVRSALWADATTPDALAAAKALPASDPTHGGTFYIASAEAKALGLADPTDTGVDGYVGLDSTTSFTFDPNNRAQPGLVDAIGALEHEITEVLGRTSYLGYQPGDGSSLYGALDLFRYTAPGVLNPSSATGSFSVNGQTLLLPFDNPINGGDSGDWSQTVTGDSFDAFGGPNEADVVSATDLRVMDVLGYHPVAVAPALQTPSVTPVLQQTEVYSDLHIAAGQTTYFINNGASVWGYTLQSGDTPPYPIPSLTNEGTIVASGGAFNTTAVTVSGGFSRATSTILNAAGATILAEASATYSAGAPIATGIEANISNATANVENAGLIEALAPGGWAEGVDSTSFKNDASGVVDVWAAGMAWGVMTSNFSNAGAISVVGGGQITNDPNFLTVFWGSLQIGDIGVVSGGAFSNTGTLSVHNEQPGSVGIGVELTGATGVLQNSGVIQADIAFYVSQDVQHQSNITPTALDLTLNNTGQIIGAVVLSDGVDSIHNTGTIAGAITFGDGQGAYDGAGGHLYGAVYLGLGTNTVTLGGDGGIVYGGGGADTITGGAGDDVIEIPRGDNTIDGGGGFNTLSFADADGAVTANLATGSATIGGTDHLRNIQRLIGSDYDDTLIAGAAAAVLIGGGGHDTLIGGGGADTLVSGSDGGTMTGGGGNDTFVYTQGDQQLVITDFNAGDVLDIYGYAAAQSTQQQGQDALITLASGDTVLLKNVQATTLNASNLHYSSLPMAPPSAPQSPADFGSTSTKLLQSFAIAAGEHFDIAAPFIDESLSYDNIPMALGLLEIGSGLQPRTFTNAGEIHVSDNVFDVVAGLLFDPYAGGKIQITNAAGAKFVVDNSVGWAVGILGGGENVIQVGLENSGLLQVTAQGFAVGLEDYDTSDVVNHAGATISATSTSALAGALVLHGGSTIENDGTIESSGVGPSTPRFVGWAMNVAIWSYAGFGQLTNTGRITATAQGGPSYGIYVTGLDGPNPASLINQGVISATIAIKFDVGANSPLQAPSVNLVNSGTINGDVDLGGGFNSVANTGVINGNLLLHDDNTSYYGGSGDTVDLRGGALNGYIQITAGESGGTAAFHDLIYTGAGASLIKLVGSDADLTLTVVGWATGQTSIQFDIASTSATETQNADGTWTVNAGDRGLLTLSHVQSLVFTDKTVTLATAAAAPVADDFNGDGKSDFLIQNGSGAVVTGQISGGQAAYAQVAALGPEWSFVGSGNVLGDGKSDFVIHNAAGAVVAGEVGSGGQAAYAQVAALGSEWAFHGVGDFLGDGHADFLIQNTAGAVVLGELSNGQTSYSQIAALGPEWSFKGVGDFNSDGKADFLIENGSGAIVLGEVGQNGQAGYSQIGALGPEWAFKEVGSFLGDGKAGFLIESAGGAVVVGEVVGGQASYTQIAALGPEWSFVGAGDYLGEGHDQFLMQSTTGAVVVGDWSGGQIHYTQVAALGAEWHFHP